MLYRQATKLQAARIHLLVCIAQTKAYLYCV